MFKLFITGSKWLPAFFALIGLDRVYDWLAPDDQISGTASLEHVKDAVGFVLFVVVVIPLIVYMLYKFGVKQRWWKKWR